MLLVLFLSFSLLISAEEDPYLKAYSNLLKPWSGEQSAALHQGVRGRVLCGYQGWFRCEGDGSGMGWSHYQQDVRGQGPQFRPGACSIDLWPDMTEYGADERFATAFRHADGSVAEVFSSQHPATVKRHFRWMADYGIDGAFVQRFAVVARPGQQTYGVLEADNRKLVHCREAANQAGRCWALMYDLSGITDENMARVGRDWTLLRKHMDLGTDPAYLRHRGKPLVAVWGGGFEGENRPSVKAVIRFVRLLKENPDWGGFSIMLGVPTGWRERERDCLDDPDLETLLGLADILSPWTPGRYRDPEEVTRHAREFWRPDLEKTAMMGIDYLPVVFPGFSWHNHMRGGAELDEIPRLGGRFLWKQFLEAKGAGATGVYVAMFDELDEGTAVFKVTSDPPVGASPFLGCVGLPSDHYLWLCGEAGKLFREELPMRGAVLPKR